MFHNKIKLGLLTALFSLVLVGCGSNSAKDNTDSTVTEVDTTPVTTVRTGTSENTEVDGSDMAMDIATVFYFDFDKSILKPEARAALQMHAKVLMKSPRNIRLEGHADERGTREYNMALGERRANAVKDFLVMQGVNGANIEVISYGEERPVDARSTEMAMSKNRRVELK